MNAEKLQALVKLATVRVNNPYIGSSGNVVLDCWEEQLSIELLAELIVKDCASICEINGRSYKHSFTPATTMSPIQRMGTPRKAESSFRRKRSTTPTITKKCSSLPTCEEIGGRMKVADISDR
jgi:hypothetical protein